jgi:hypothetical protein
LVLALAACGGGGDSGDTPPGIGSLAYVETQCRGTKQGFTEHQALRIRQGDHEPVTVFETPQVSVPGRGDLCQWVGGRYGPSSIMREPLQWLAVSPDGSSVVFESTDEFSVNPPLPLNLPEDKKGIFWVRADGTGLPRKLGPPSAIRLFDVVSGLVVDYSSGVPASFSPDGRTLAFVDKGPDADGNAADQVFTIDVTTGARTQVTRLPRAVPPAGFSANSPTVFGPLFIDERTISFYSSGNPDGLNPRGVYILMTTRADGSGFDVPLPIPVPLPGGTIELRFVITGERPQAISVIVPGTPTGGVSGYRQEISEVFVIDEGKNILQLTSFRRNDTWYALADVGPAAGVLQRLRRPAGHQPVRELPAVLNRPPGQQSASAHQLPRDRPFRCGLRLLSPGARVYCWRPSLAGSAQSGRALLFQLRPVWHEPERRTGFRHPAGRQRAAAADRLARSGTRSAGCLHRRDTRPVGIRAVCALTVSGADKEV